MVRTAAAGERPALTAYFFYNDRACGKVTREVALGGTIGTVREVVAPTGNGGDGPPPAFEIDARAPLADIVVDVMDPHKTGSISRRASGRVA